MRNLFKGLLIGGLTIASGFIFQNVHGQYINNVAITPTVQGGTSGANFPGYPSTGSILVNVANYDPVNAMNNFALDITLTLPTGAQFPSPLVLTPGWSLVPGYVFPTSIRITNSSLSLTNSANIFGSQTQLVVPISLNAPITAAAGTFSWGVASGVQGGFQNPQTGVLTSALNQAQNTGSGTITVSNTPLPVEFVGPEATVNGCTVNVNWVTTMEKNNKLFIVERSADGSRFSKLGEVNGAGNSSIEIKYQFEDKAPLNGHNIYRIRQVDFDDKSTTSKNANAKVDCNVEAISMFPNPSDGVVYVKGLTSKSTINVYNMLGQLVSTKNVENTIEGLNLTSLASGSYQVQVVANEAVVFSAKLVKN